MLKQEKKDQEEEKKGLKSLNTKKMPSRLAARLGKGGKGSYLPPRPPLARTPYTNPFSHQLSIH